MKTVVDSNGEMVADRVKSSSFVFCRVVSYSLVFCRVLSCCIVLQVRVTWGRLQNFKCVDYFQIEYWEQNDKAGTFQASSKMITRRQRETDFIFQVTEKINRHRSSFDVTIKPCRDLLFRVIASEDWQGTRQDYRVGSENVNFRVDYAPKVKSHFANVQSPSQRA